MVEYRFSAPFDIGSIPVRCSLFFSYNTKPYIINKPNCSEKELNLYVRNFKPVLYR